MIERDSCFFCTSPFQFFSILALATEQQEIADLYIDPQFSGAALFAERIKGKNIFHNVEVINSSKIYNKYMRSKPGIKNHLQIAKTYLHVEEITKMILLPGIKYKNIYLSSKAYFPRIIQLYYIKKKWDFNLYYFDDGAGSYYNDRAYQIKKTDKLVRWLLFGKKSIDTGHKRFVFAPDIYKLLNPNKSNEIKRIQRFWEEEAGRRIINYIFNVSDKILIKEKLIILDQPKDEILNTADIESINNIYRLLVEKIGFGNAIIKKHPRSPEKEIEQVNYFPENGIPFEIYCMNMNMNKKIIIGYSSTAVATPKILFNQEPMVIVLTKLFRPKTGELNLFEDYFLAVKNAYSNPKRFCIPGSWEELNNIMNELHIVKVG